MVRRTLGALLLIAAGFALAGCGGGSSSSNNGNLYVATQGDNQVSAYQIDTSNGTVNSIGDSQSTGTTPSVLVLNPSGTTLYVANQGDNSVSFFPVNSDGSLGGSSGDAPLDGTPQSMAINSAGTFLFVTIENALLDPGSVQVFSVSGTSLSSVGTFTAGVGASGIAVAPSGNQVYVANSIDGTVSAFSVDASGALSQIAAPYVTGGSSPTGVGIPPSGSFVYVTNTGSNNVSAYAACIAVTSVCPVADGSLIEVTGSPFATNLKPTVVVAHPTLDVIYVLDSGSNQISQFSFGSGSGVLTALTPPTVSTGASPVSLVAQPGGLQVFTANIGATNITGFNINRTSGALMPTNQMILTGGQPAALATK